MFHPNFPHHACVAAEFFYMNANMLLQVRWALKVLTFSFCQVFRDLAGFRTEKFMVITHCFTRSFFNNQSFSYCLARFWFLYTGKFYKANSFIFQKDNVVKRKVRVEHANIFYVWFPVISIPVFLWK